MLHDCRQLHNTMCVYLIQMEVLLLKRKEIGKQHSKEVHLHLVIVSRALKEKYGFIKKETYCTYSPRLLQHSIQCCSCPPPALH